MFGIWGADTAAAMVALGLHALQHRGQEAAGITSWDGRQFHTHRAMGHVAGNFDRDEIIRALPGRVAVRPCPLFDHRRDGAAQRPAACSPNSRSGGFAVSHNGNISNAMKLRRELVRRGSIFQSTSDTETIIHLVATSSYRTLLDRFIDALKQVEGAYSLVCLTPEGMIACRDPLGIRPLVMGRVGDAYIFASETVALDVVGADLPARGRARRADHRLRAGRPLDPPVRAGAPAPVHLRACLFLAARFDRRRHLGLFGAQGDRRGAGARKSGRGRSRRPGARFGHAGGDRLCAGSRASRSSSASSARIMSAAPSSSPAIRSATSASS